MSDYNETIAETTNITEADVSGVGMRIQDTFACTTIDQNAWANTATNSDSFNLTSPSLVFGWGRQISDSFAAVMTVIGIRAILAYDNLSLEDVLTPKYRGTQIAQDAVMIYDHADLAKVLRLTLAEALALAESFDSRMMLVIQEYLNTLDTVIINRKGTDRILDACSITGTAVKGFGKTLAEVLSGSDSGLALFVLGCAIHEIVGTTETVGQSLTRNAVVISALSAVDAGISTASFSNSLLDEIDIDFRLVLDGQIYQCWVLNTESLAPSIYTNFNFNSFVELDSTVYAADSGGIYTLVEGTDDDSEEIQTGVKINLYNMGFHYKKRLYRGYFGVVGETPAVKMITELGEVQYYIFDGRIKVVKGHEGREWTFNLTQVDAVDFVELTALVMLR